jgi:hypothetical protein
MKPFDDFETQIQCEEVFLEEERLQPEPPDIGCCLDELPSEINPHFGMTREQLQQAADAENQCFLGETPLGEKYDLMEEQICD